MPTFQKPKLGDVTAITIASANLDDSLKYYQQLGFSELFRADFPFPFIQISDGALLIMLRRDDNPYIALTYFTKELDKVVAEIKQAGISVKLMATPNPMIQRYIIKTEEGHNITFVTFVDGFEQPTGVSMISIQQQDFFNPDKYTNKICGMYGEFALPVNNLTDSILFWEKLGFTSLSKNQSPYPWAILSDGLAIVGLHQTNDFNKPSITYFAADMKNKIEKLKKAGINNFIEKGNSSIVLTTPEQQHINLFKMGM